MNSRLEAIHPVLQARDVAKSIAFYRSLGFEVVFQDSPTNPKYVGIEREGLQLHLQWADPQQWAYPVDRPVYRFMVSDVDAAFAEFTASSGLSPNSTPASPFSEPKETSWGTREFHARDPSGNALQFYRSL
jgi:catechol 2,3-dioxygenase-like lactoylglutathione lyase family enzyme